MKKSNTILMIIVIVIIASLVVWKIGTPNLISKNKENTTEKVSKKVEKNQRKQKRRKKLVRLSHPLLKQVAVRKVSQVVKVLVNLQAVFLVINPM